MLSSVKPNIANGLDTDQVGQNVGPDLAPNLFISLIAIKSGPML